MGVTKRISQNKEEKKKEKKRPRGYRESWWKRIPRHGLPEVGNLAPYAAELGGHKDEVGVVSVDEVVQLLFHVRATTRKSTAGLGGCDMF